MLLISRVPGVRRRFPYATKCFLMEKFCTFFTKNIGFWSLSYIFRLEILLNSARIDMALDFEGHQFHGWLKIVVGNHDLCEPLDVNFSCTMIRDHLFYKSPLLHFTTFCKSFMHNFAMPFTLMNVYIIAFQVSWFFAMWY